MQMLLVLTLCSFIFFPSIGAPKMHLVSIQDGWMIKRKKACVSSLTHGGNEDVIKSASALYHSAFHAEGGSWGGQSEGESEKIIE